MTDILTSMSSNCILPLDYIELLRQAVGFWTFLTHFVFQVISSGHWGSVPHVDDYLFQSRDFPEACLHQSWRLKIRDSGEKEVGERESWNVRACYSSIRDKPAILVFCRTCKQLY
jgi:hypothetical protein